MMSGIRAKNTKPEITVRKQLHRDGFRYRLNVRALPGTPDIVLPKFRAVIFINGCFWHGHDCPLFKLPSTRTEFWQQKIERNRQKDAESKHQLLLLGWRVATVWECALRGRQDKAGPAIQQLENWIQENGTELEIRG